MEDKKWHPTVSHIAFNQHLKYLMSQFKPIPCLCDQGKCDIMQLCLNRYQHC